MARCRLRFAICGNGAAGATIAGGCEVGPFARLRPGTELKQGARVGNFVELKKASVGPGAKGPDRGHRVRAADHDQHR